MQLSMGSSAWEKCGAHVWRRRQRGDFMSRRNSLIPLKLFRHFSTEQKSPSTLPSDQQKLSWSYKMVPSTTMARCIICRWPIGFGSVKVSSLDFDVFKNWWRSNLGYDLEEEVFVYSSVCEQCIYKARLVNFS